MALKEQTLQLKETIDNLKERYLSSDKPEDRKDPALFKYVKEETSPIFDEIQKWEDVALAFVKDRQVTVHPQQVASTKENMDLLLMHSYYIDVRKTRYMELHQSIHYVFDAILSQIND